MHKQTKTPFFGYKYMNNFVCQVLRKTQWGQYNLIFLQDCIHINAFTINVFKIVTQKSTYLKLTGY